MAFAQLPMAFKATSSLEASARGQRSHGLFSTDHLSIPIHDSLSLSLSLSLTHSLILQMIIISGVNLSKIPIARPNVLCL